MGDYTRIAAALAPLREECRRRLAPDLAAAAEEDARTSELLRQHAVLALALGGRRRLATWGGDDA
jgi:hypothetical protein